MEGTLDWGATAHQVSTCDALPSQNTALCETTSVYSFTELECVKTPGPCVSGQIYNEQQDRNETALTLTISD